MTAKISCLPLKSKGVTLVELMVAMALGLLLTAGAISLLVSSKQVYRTEDAMSRNQESGRFAVDFIARKVRMVGFTGCSNLEELEPVIIADPPPINGFELSSALIGYEGDGTNGMGETWDNVTTIERVEGTDIITLGSAGECGADLVRNMDVVNANLKIGGGGGDCSFETGDYLLLTDCETADLFRASTVSESTGMITIAQASNYNTANFLSKTYQAGSGLYHFVRTSFFIGVSPSGNPSLYEVEYSDPVVTRELVENVEDIQYQYGIDTDADGRVNAIRDASQIVDWSDVLSVNISLLMRSDDDLVTTEPQVIVFNGGNVNEGEDGDRRLRTAFNSNVSIRNRVP